VNKDRLLFPVSTALRSAEGPTQLPWVVSFGLESAHSSPSSAEVKNDGAVRFLPHTSLWSSDNGSSEGHSVFRGRQVTHISFYCPRCDPAPPRV
jgi:hypothetical protein